VFKCPFCAHESSCEVRLDREAETGTISCRVCGESFQTRVSYLSDPVDVFAAWVDELEAQKAGGGGGGEDGDEREFGNELSGGVGEAEGLT
jgi:transcription elongation factor Elf1